MRLQQGDTCGASIRCPIECLLLSSQREPLAQEAEDTLSSLPRALINAIRESLKPFMHMRDLSVDKAAEICGFKERQLRARLHALDTSLSREIALLREETAIRLLRAGPMR